MTRVRATAVLAYGVLLFLLAVAGMSYPAARSFWSDVQARRAIERDFVLATDQEQKRIVRSFLDGQLHDTAFCGAGGCRHGKIHFDRSAAVLLPIDSDEPWERYEVRSALVDRSLFDGVFTTVPIPLQNLLDASTLHRTENADPLVEGIVYVDDPEDLPDLGDDEACRSGLRLVRISRAAVHQPEGMAVALIHMTYCDLSVGSHVARFRRSGDEWREEAGGIHAF